MITKTLAQYKNPATNKYQASFNATEYLTITGTGFGVKSVPTYYDDFENRPVGSISAQGVGLLKWENPNGSSIATSSPHSGTKSVVHDFSANDFPKVYKDLNEANNLTFSCWLKFSGTVTNGTVFKFGRIGSYGGSNPYVYEGAPHVGASYTSAGTSSVPQSIGGEIVTDTYGNQTSWSEHVVGVTATPEEAYIKDVWHFYEIEFYGGTVDGNNCLFEERCDNKKVTRWVNRPYRTSTNSLLANWFLLPLNGLDNSPPITYSIDEVYISESRSRIVMTDSATYSTSTKWCAQEDLSGGWSNTLIYYKPKRGNFTQGQIAYLHIFSDGVLVDTKTVMVP